MPFVSGLRVLVVQFSCVQQTPCIMSDRDPCAPEAACAHVWELHLQVFNCFLQVDYYGALTPLKAIAGISAPEATMLVVQPYDKTAMPAIEKAIMQSDIGATPNSDGNLIRIKIPALTSVSCFCAGYASM